MSAYITHLAEEAARLKSRADALKAENREDEAALCRVEINIDEICITIYNVCMKLAQGESFRALYLEKLDRLPEGWAKSRAEALSHSDACKAVIEDIKLTTLARNRAKFLELKEV